LTDVDAFLTHHSPQLGILPFQHLNHPLELENMCLLRIPINHGFILNIHGLRSILNSVEGLLIVGFSGTDTGNHVGVGVAA
jgi:hypothetical protein